MNTRDKRISYCIYLEGEPSQSEFDKNYDMREQLGTGAFAVVKVCVEKATGTKYAVKIMDKKKFLQFQQSSRDCLMDEVKILRKVHHENIVSIKEHFDTPTHLYLVLELASGGDLFDAILNKSDKENRFVYQCVCMCV